MLFMTIGGIIYGTQEETAAFFYRKMNGGR